MEEGRGFLSPQQLKSGIQGIMQCHVGTQVRAARKETGEGTGGRKSDPASSGLILKAGGAGLVS
jgi:hypothetical protein